MTDRTRLLDLLKKYGFRKGTFTLASGRQSDFYIDVRSVALSSEGHWLLGHVLLDKLRGMFPSGRYPAVAGVELGGCPLVSAISCCSRISNDSPPNLPAIYVRKKPKGHGSKKLVEAPYSAREGDEVVLVEDVVTSGGSSLWALHALVEAGFKPVGLIVVVDRKEGGLEAIKAEHPDLVVESLFTRFDFIPEVTGA